VTDPARAARAVVDAANAGVLSTLTAAGDPWGALVAYGLLAGGAPVLLVSALAEHGRNLARDPRASLVVTGPLGPDPAAAERVTLAGRVHTPADADAARAAFLAAVPGAAVYAGFADFTLHVLAVERVRWVGGPGRMGSADGAAYAAAAP